ncbi:MAG: NUDIX hydrolase [Gemmatimonadetes bacterium]|nr:NUDIX hydrolase [Gemmatimonadota bacterium]
MFVNAAVLAEGERRWGAPAERGFHVATEPDEIAFIRKTQKNDRAHDVTMLIRHGDRIAAIAKHHYPSRIYRLPSGGLEPGESLEEGILRETLEETGLRVDVTRYLLRARVRFVGPEPEQVIDWTSHVFEANVRVGTVPDGELDPTDRREIRDVVWVSREELLGPIRERLRAWRDHGGIRYRRQLHDAIFEEVDRRTRAAEER